jgi:hypothetical protein
MRKHLESLNSLIYENGHLIKVTKRVERPELTRKEERLYKAGMIDDAVTNFTLDTVSFKKAG